MERGEHKVAMYSALVAKSKAAVPKVASQENVELDQNMTPKHRGHWWSLLGTAKIGNSGGPCFHRSNVHLKTLLLSMRGWKRKRASLGESSTSTATICACWALGQIDVCTIFQKEARALSQTRAVDSTQSEA